MQKRTAYFESGDKFEKIIGYFMKDPFNATALKSPTLLIGYLKPFLLMTTDSVQNTYP